MLNEKCGTSVHSADGDFFVEPFLHTAFMSFSDWREPTRLLKETAGPPTDGQLDLAARIGIRHAREPRTVFAAVIEAWLLPAIWQKQPPLATGRQLAFLGELGHEHEVVGLPRSVASAWIGHYLSLRTVRALEELRLNAGDVVDHEHRHVDAATGEISVWFQSQIVSSIRRDGFVYFRGERSVRMAIAVAS